ncbi:flagellar hook-basal body protein [Planococcus sp. CPCC 101016]|uniref:flagellar hook-basal body protein n=1 Tax=Planococcus sp. CPCC 101016 TaxID=2599617 RepID=UPI0011B3F359|nr:flagellar hook-basal body protein [Planococcus sp. CPCC 101016]TWT04472.1 flagellar hook-basal body protein [Planococcus sp. CPCC 101016]
MFRGLYTATSGMMANNRMQQVLTNNLSNTNTPGFKEDQTVMRAFPNQLIKAMEAGKKGTIVPQNIGTLTTGVYAQEGIPSFLQGPLKETGNTTDLVLMDELLPINPETQQKGTMVFAVAADNNEVRYTKNGTFAVNAEGALMTSDGFPVLGENQQPIQVGSTNFTVQDNGQIVLADGTQGGRLWMGHTENPDQFVKEGQNLLRWAGNPEGTPQFVDNVALLNNTESLVKQGFIEQSNVDLTQTMTDMMTTYRGFESNQKVIQAYDRSMEKAVNEIGRV